MVDGARAAGLRARVDGSVDRVFAALGDPGRRELVRAISERGSANRLPGAPPARIIAAADMLIPMQIVRTGGLTNCIVS